MTFRDRIKAFRRVRAGDIKPNPKNWREHPESQRKALQGVLAEVGFADAVLARELDGGKLMLVDGHLRLDEVPKDAEIPVLVLDVDEYEADKLLATIDPLAAMAEANKAKLSELLAGIETESAELQALLEQVAKDAPVGEGSPGTPPAEVSVGESFQVVVECASEDDQRRVFERMTGEGYKCRVLTL